MSLDHWTQEQARQLAQTIAIDHDEAAHGACLDALENYITAQLAQQNYQALFPSVARHLDSCVACAEAYALVYEVRIAQASDLAAIVVPDPNLDFLRAGTASSLQRKLAEAVERLAPQRIRFTLTQTLLDLLTPQAPAFAFRSPDEMPLLTVTVDQAVGDQVQIQLSVYQERGSRDLCTVRSQIALAGREWPDLGGISVALTIGGQERQATTDPWGEVVFENVPRLALAGLQIEVDAGRPPQIST